MAKKVYWCNRWAIYSTDLDGDHAETVFHLSTMDLCKFHSFFLSVSCTQASHSFLLFDLTADDRIDGLAFEPFAGNVYIAVSNPYEQSGGILACDTERAGYLTCATVLSEDGKISGIALNPIEGLVSIFCKLLWS